MSKVLKNIGRVILYALGVLLIWFAIVSAPDIYWSIRGFQYIKPQPKYLLTVDEYYENGERDLLIRIEADLIMHCSNRYDFRVSQNAIGGDTIGINVDGLYYKGYSICILSAKRPVDQFPVHFKSVAESINLIVKSQDKIDKYEIKMSPDGASTISPRGGIFSEIIAYHYQDKLIWKTDKYLYPD